MLFKEGLIIHTIPFRLVSRFAVRDILKAGEYNFPPHSSVFDIVTLLNKGKTVIRRLTMPEGMTSAEIVKMLNEEPSLTGTIDAIPPEGSLLPETYHYSYGDSRAAILDRMRRQMKEALDMLWQRRAPDSFVTTPEQAVTLASIVEKETARADERRRVAGVYVNRLKQNMKLQADPTTIYAVTNGQGPLNREITLTDLATQSPYNTYFALGLPPGPIANPGRASLEAALDPEKHDFIFFVADGSGGHVFSRTVEEHNLNVAKWRQLRAQPKP
jgi:UPF0755 protein